MLDGDSWRDPKGRAPISFRQLMKKMKLTEDEVLAEVSRLGASFDAEKHFAAEPAKESKRGRPKKAVTSDTDSDSAPKKRGRPKKAAKVVEVSATEDLFANLVEQAKTSAPEADVSDLSGSDSDSDAGSKKSSKKQKLTEAEKAEKKAARDAEKAKAKEEKEAKEAQQKAEKKAARDAEKAKAKEAKEAKEAQEKAEKKAARDADKAKAKEAKEAKEKADKEAKAAAKAAKGKKAEAAPVASEELTPEVEEEEAVKVEKFEIKGTMYLKSADNTLYDMKTQDEIGVWNPKTKEIEEQEEDSDED
jgi:colicin import membrane protein